MTTKQRRGSPDGGSGVPLLLVRAAHLLATVAPSCPVLSPTGVSSSALLLLAPHRMRILLCSNDVLLCQKFAQTISGGGFRLNVSWTAPKYPAAAPAGNYARGTTVGGSQAAGLLEGLILAVQRCLQVPRPGLLAMELGRTTLCNQPGQAAELWSQAVGGTSPFGGRPVAAAIWARFGPIDHAAAVSFTASPPLRPRGRSGRVSGPYTPGRAVRGRKVH